MGKDIMGMNYFSLLQLLFFQKNFKERLYVVAEFVIPFSFFNGLLIHIQSFVHLYHDAVVICWDSECLTVGERLIHTHLIPIRHEMLDDVANNDLVWTSFIIIKSYADIYVWRIGVQEIRQT